MTTKNKEMQNDLKELTTMIDGLHKGIGNKSEMFTTGEMEAMFKCVRSATERMLNIDKIKSRSYLEEQMAIATKLYTIVEMTKKYLSKNGSLDTLDFYRLVRCGKLEKDLKDLLEFYRTRQRELFFDGMVSFKMNI
jgi:hypothetical protein